MNYNQDYLRQLITEKLTGAISVEDKLYLEECIRSDKQSASLWEEMQSKWTTLQGDSILKHVHPGSELENIKHILHSPAKSFSINLKQVCAAAVVLVIVAVSWMVMHRKEPIVPNHVALKSGAPKKIELLLGTGKTLNISGQVQTIQVDDITLKTSGGVLQYTGTSRVLEQFNTLNIPEKLDYQIILSDGSRVWLNSSSSLKFPFAFTSQKREVYLSGEAYFEVAKDAKHPFLVHTPKTTIQVLGTSFNVNTYETGVEKTSLVEGRVKTIAANGDSMLLRPGYEASYDELHQGFQIKEFDKQYVLSWMEGSYLFNNVPLQSLTGTLERWFGINVIPGNNEVARKTIVSGIIEKGKLKEFLENLQASTGIKYSLVKNTLHFTDN